MTNIFTRDAPGLFSDMCIHIVLQRALKIMHCEQVFFKWDQVKALRNIFKRYGRH